MTETKRHFYMICYESLAYFALSIPLSSPLARSTRQRNVNDICISKYIHAYIYMDVFKEKQQKCSHSMLPSNVLKVHASVEKKEREDI